LFLLIASANLQMNFRGKESHLPHRARFAPLIHARRLILKPFLNHNDLNAHNYVQQQSNDVCQVSELFSMRLAPKCVLACENNHAVSFL
jgi:hypothetical protein